MDTREADGPYCQSFLKIHNQDSTSNLCKSSAALHTPKHYTTTHNTSQPACNYCGKNKRPDTLSKTGSQFHFFDQSVETVENFKYLGSALDSQRSFSVNTESTFKKSSHRLYLLRRIRSLSVKKLQVVYKSLVASVLTFHLPAQHSHLNCLSKNKLRS